MFKLPGIPVGGNEEFLVTPSSTKGGAIYSGPEHIRIFLFRHTLVFMASTMSPQVLNFINSKRLLRPNSDNNNVQIDNIVGCLDFPSQEQTYSIHRDCGHKLLLVSH